MSRTPFIGANWKMNPPPAGALDRDSPFRSSGKTEVVVFPTFLDLAACLATALRVGAQCARPEETGAFTGDISMAQLRALGVTHVLCGHSERRIHHGEKNADVALQVRGALGTGLVPIVCMGETDTERREGKTEMALCANIETIFRGVEASAACIVAYEPVWAIGTGKTPTPNDVQAAHAFIRSLLPSKNTRIIYGGSVNSHNARDFLALPDIDGALVGGCSLKPEGFRTIVGAAG